MPAPRLKMQSNLALAAAIEEFLESDEISLKCFIFEWNGKSIDKLVLRYEQIGML
jgi:hypothetical protein